MIEKIPFVLVETPFSAPTVAGIVRNVAYAMLAVKDCLGRDEAPYASHLFFTQMLDDNDPNERLEGIHAGLAIGRFAARTAVYTDLGISGGMKYGIKNAEEANREITYRKLYDDTATEADIDEMVRREIPLDYSAIAAVYARIL